MKYQTFSDTNPEKKSYNGLAHLEKGLEAARYFDPELYQEELEKVWYRNWIYICRGSDLKEPRSFFKSEVGTQSFFLVRDQDGEIHGFFNTCRHRGASLCEQDQGQLKSSQILCSYHCWSYNLKGELQRTNSKQLPEGFDAKALSLYPVAVREWNGFVFVNLAENPPPFETGFDSPLDRYKNWPMVDLVRAHSFKKEIECNWKVFWENYNECLHCPSIHPSLSKLVPIFSRALMEEKDDPHWKQNAESGDPKFNDPKYKGGLRSGASTWSMDGKSTVSGFPNVSEEDRKMGQTYVTLLPTAFFVAHVDYIRTVRLRPMGPERTEVWVDYLTSKEILEDPHFNLNSIVEFTSQVLNEDAKASELNQRGLKSLRHGAGVLMPEEWSVLSFQRWVMLQCQS